ncbi:hypothetical protein [Pseudomonas orientalis]|uniref:hypothetical protein n=1 Tax=Pseudomonas orientalis TaxID=76758 RepID=UPI000F561800|nr:hypothetical protein [Pseudomonas orientalis]AZE90922.1 hypothetical protein C4J97_4249 [Pseudomonas orientalis]
MEAIGQAGGQMAMQFFSGLMKGLAGGGGGGGDESAAKAPDRPGEDNMPPPPPKIEIAAYS